MTKKDYEAIATVFQSAKLFNNPGERFQWQALRDEMANMLGRNNGRFDRDRFIRACEPGANVRARG